MSTRHWERNKRAHVTGRKGDGKLELGVQRFGTIV